MQLKEVAYVSIRKGPPIRGGSIGEGGRIVYWTDSSVVVMPESVGGKRDTVEEYIANPISAVVTGPGELEVVTRDSLFRVELSAGMPRSRSVWPLGEKASSAAWNGEKWLFGRFASDSSYCVWTRGIADVAINGCYSIRRGAGVDSTDAVKALGSSAIVTVGRLRWRVYALRKTGAEILRTGTDSSARVSSRTAASPAILLDEVTIIQSVADLQSDVRRLMLYSLVDSSVRTRDLNAPIGIVGASPRGSFVLAVREAGGEELVVYSRMPKAVSW
jgi:hypothetical protein